MRALSIVLGLALAGCSASSPPRALHRPPPAPVTPDPIEGVEDAFAIRVVDDEVDLMPRPPSEDEDWPPNMMWQAERVPLGPTEEATRHFLELPVEGSSEATVAKLGRYAARLPLPKGDALGFFVREASEVSAKASVRTVLVGARLAGPRELASATKTAKGYVITLKDEAAPRVIAALERASKRRMVVLVGGRIVAAPTVLPKAKSFVLAEDGTVSPE